MIGLENGSVMPTRPRVCHRKQEWFFVLKVEVLVLKFLAIDRFSSSPVSGCEVTTLYHEGLDHAMEN
jgi:hypothetical protein